MQRGELHAQEALARETHDPLAVDLLDQHLGQDGVGPHRAEAGAWVGIERAHELDRLLDGFERLTALLGDLG